MANTHHTESNVPSLSRRTVLAGTAAVVVGATPAIAGTGNPDAELIDLADEYHRTIKAGAAADAELIDAEIAAELEMPERPMIMRRVGKQGDGEIIYSEEPWGELDTLNLKMTLGSILGWDDIHNREPTPQMLARADECEKRYRPQLDTHEANCTAILKRHGVPELEAKAKTLLTKAAELQERVFSVQPKTVAGVAAKLEAILAEQCAEDPSSMVFDKLETVALWSVLDDARRIGGAS